jgi:hypothetical protein
MKSLRTVARAARPFTSVQPFQPRYYASKESAEEGTGVQQKGDKNARPVILEHSPPAEETEDVKKHNEEFEKRPDRSANQIDDKNQAVNKGFWQGQNFQFH